MSTRGICFESRTSPQICNLPNTSISVPIDVSLQFPGKNKEVLGWLLAQVLFRSNYTKYNNNKFKNTNTYSLLGYESKLYNIH